MYPLPELGEHMRRETYRDPILSSMTNGARRSRYALLTSPRDPSVPITGQELLCWPERA